MGAGETKRCGCGLVHGAGDWAALEYVGEIDDGVERIEMRQCGACRSCLSVVVGPSVRPSIRTVAA